MLIDDFSVRFRSDCEVQEIAFRWRKKLDQYFFANCVDICAVFAAVGAAIGRPIIVEARPDPAMGRANAFVSKDRRTVYVRQGLIDAAATGDREAVFDAVHELGHVILHSESVPLARMASRDNRHKFLQPEESAEHQANLFARSFLMTDEEVKRFPTEEALSDNCYTPLEQARLRLAEYGRTTAQRMRSLERHQSAEIAKLKGYGSIPCPDCRQFRLLRSGTCWVCDSCGCTSPYQ